ncbi:MAG TPA: hypothetical protein ENJ53_02770 [Phaeodactylibacter sp.]|nr:hypothetical protein [Phaeodactylibacter sp.]
MKELTKDLLWKAIVEDLFEDFMDYFFEEYVHLIDFEKGYTFLDKELQTILPDADNSDRIVDKLVKVWLKNGEEKWILIHIEVQGYWDNRFSYRTYSSHYRIRDKYDKPVGVFVIYTDKNPTFHPKEYREECFGTLSLLQFPTYKVLDHPPEKETKKDNPFSIVMEVVWYEIMKQQQKNKISDEDYLEIGTKIVWKLARRDYGRDRIQKVLQFTKYYVPFEKPKNFVKFGEEIYIVLENKKDMGIIELVRNHEIEVIREKGREEGVETIIKNGLDADFSLEQISLITKLSIDEVKSIIKKNEW